VISNEQNGNSRFGTSRACACLGSSFSFSPSAYFINLGISSLAQSNPFYFSRVSFTRLWRSNGFPFLSHCKHSTFARTNLAFSFGLSFPYRFMMFGFHIRSPLVQVQITRALYIVNIGFFDLPGFLAVSAAINNVSLHARASQNLPYQKVYQVYNVTTRDLNADTRDAN